jgi:tetratricopeptide (TPR) repeat protein
VSASITKVITTDVQGAAVESRRRALRLKEAEADDRGFLYAGLAGYRVDTLLGESGAGKADFFHDWLSQTQTRLDPSHPDPAERATLLRVQLSRLQEKLEFFYTGVRLTHFGAYADAEYFLREFQTVFPAREVHNNLGYGYLQRARREMPPALAYRYCLPTLLDTTTRAAAIVQRGGGEETTALTAEARTLLLQAVDALNRAVTADSTYLPARLNLAAAYFYLDEIYQARAVIEAARKLAPDDREVQNLRALILYREGVDADTWPSALKLLEDLAAQPQASACLTYNLAQLLEERQRSAKARTIWTALAQRLPELPPPYRQTVCEHAATEATCRTLTTAPAKVPAPPWPLPVPLGLDLLQEPDRAKQYLAGWTATAFDWQQPGLKGHLYRGPQGAAVLELDGYVELVALRGEELGTEDTLRSCCGQPTRQQPVVGGMLWSYGNQWATLVREGQVAEVWVKRQPVRP